MPLEQVRVVEMTNFLFGPYTGRLLAELGAEVIKVEPPWGEPYRTVPPQVNGDSLHFIFTNANKKFITLNVKNEKGRMLLLELLKKSDIFIENFRPGTLDKLSLGYKDISKVNPRLIYVSCSGYGHEGPYSDFPAFDPCVQAISGLMDTNGYPDAPTRLGMGVLDLAAPAFVAVAILAALRHRDKTGEGQWIDMSLFDVAVLLSQQSMVYSIAGLPVRVGPSSNIFAPEYLYKTKDGYVYVVIHSEEAWQKLATRFGSPEVARDQRFKTNEDRLRNREELLRLTSEWFKQVTTQEAIQIINEIGGVAGEYRELKNQLYDPNVVARNLYTDVKHPSGNFVRIPGSVFRMSKVKGVVKHPGLPLGFNNDEIYRQLLNISSEELQQLKKEGVI